MKLTQVLLIHMTETYNQTYRGSRALRNLPKWKSQIKGIFKLKELYIMWDRVVRWSIVVAHIFYWKEGNHLWNCWSSFRNYQTKEAEEREIRGSRKRCQHTDCSQYNTHRPNLHLNPRLASSLHFNLLGIFFLWFYNVIALWFDNRS